ncbi:MAG: agmatine deiminase family protein [Balneolaceae bacterium]|nr:agmatine deiminase family protein [Balneolaceae bacterium]
MKNFYQLFNLSPVTSVLIICAFLFLQGCADQQIPGTEILVQRQPAEFEDQEALWINWPPVEHKTGMSNEEVMLQVIEAVAESGQEIRIAVFDEEMKDRAQNMIDEAITSPGMVSIHIVPYYEWWVRDTGPAFVELQSGEMAVVNFRFDAWGYTTPDDEEIQVDAEFARNLGQYLNMPVIESELISEGGNREVNGRGTLMLTAAVEEGRNPDWSREEMESEFERLLGVTNVIWLEEGIIDDQHTFLGPLMTHEGVEAYTVVTTNGHIDEFARFLDERTILLGYIPEEDLEGDPIARENHQRMEVNYEILRNSTDQDGNPFEIIRMPLTRSLVHTMNPGDYVYDYISTLDYADGHEFPVGEEIHVIAAASYLNFVITPGVVIGQKYWEEGMDSIIRERDEEARQILEQVYPDREVVMVNAIPVNLGGGGLHCVTLHQPVSREVEYPYEAEM